jgi:hypothetical protein
MECEVLETKKKSGAGKKRAAVAIS